MQPDRMSPGAAQSEGECTMAGKLAGKVALVTGGSAGIGLGIAKRFAQEGARIFITGRHQLQLDEAVASIGGDAAAIEGDSTKLADLDRIYATIKARAGRIDVLMANAGVYEFGRLGDPHRLYGVDPGLRLLLGVQRVKSRGTLVRPYLDRRPQGARHPRQRVEPRIHRYACHVPFHDG
jgi:hypothetical protein